MYSLPLRARRVAFFRPSASEKPPSPDYTWVETTASRKYVYCLNYPPHASWRSIDVSGSAAAPPDAPVQGLERTGKTTLKS